MKYKGIIIMLGLVLLILIGGIAFILLREQKNEQENLNSENSTELAYLSLDLPEDWVMDKINEEYVLQQKDQKIELEETDDAALDETFLNDLDSVILKISEPNMQQLSESSLEQITNGDCQVFALNYFDTPTFREALTVDFTKINTFPTCIITYSEEVFGLELSKEIYFTYTDSKENKNLYYFEITGTGPYSEEDFSSAQSIIQTIKFK